MKPVIDRPATILEINTAAWMAHTRLERYEELKRTIGFFLADNPYKGQCFWVDAALTLPLYLVFTDRGDAFLVIEELRQLWKSYDQEAQPPAA